MKPAAPIGITPPSPGLEHEEPELRREEDIPADDGSPNAAEPLRGDREFIRRSERESTREERPLRKVERE